MANRAMKDSGVEWIGEIPKGWKVTKLRNCLRTPITDGPHETPRYVDEGIPFISVNAINGDGTINRQVANRISESDARIYNNKTNLEVGDILFTKAATIGKIAIVDVVDFMIWSPIAVIKSNKSMYNHFLKYVFMCNGFLSHVSNLGTKNTQINVGMRAMEQSKVPVLSLSEQQKIAAFLDEKVAHIDNIIEDTKKSIENLKAYKQSLITETVTKGLDTNVEMKDSDIKWIGELPANWQLVKLSRLTTSYSGGTPKRNEERYWKNGTIPWVSSGEVNKRVITESDEKISEEGLNESSAKLFPPKTVLVALNGQGKTKAMSALLEIEAATNQSLVGFIPNKLLNYKYLNFTFIASYSYNRSYYAGGNKRDGIAAGELKSRLIPLPSIDIQIEIVRFLEGKISHINSLILEKENLLISLNTYKKSIIYEYVTGKKEVK